VSEDTKPAPGFSLRRWSARKRAAAGQAKTAAAGPAIDTPPSPAAPGAIPPDAPPSRAAAGRPDAPVAATGFATTATDAAATNTALPPLESLTPQSDFTPFMRPDVEPSLRSAALRKLCTDPHFNVMDGLDTYIDDYSKPDPISPDMVKLLNHARYIFAPPPTRLNAQGFVEDVPEEELAALAQSQAAPGTIAQTESPAAPQAIDPAAALPGAPGDGLPSDAADGRLADDAPRQIRLPLDAPPDRPA
jgi:hypothetical protein